MRARNLLPAAGFHAGEMRRAAARPAHVPRNETVYLCRFGLCRLENVWCGRFRVQAGELAAPSPAWFQVHHAAMLGTAVLMDPDAVIPAESSADDAGAASFRAECGAWALGDKEVCWHDGRTGRLLQAAPNAGNVAVDEDEAAWTPPTASAALYRRFGELLTAQAQVAGDDGGARHEMGYDEAKRAVAAATGYGRARQLLLFGARTKLHRSLAGRGVPLAKVGGLHAR